MTGGRRREDDYRGGFRARPVLSTVEQRTEEVLAIWVLAARFRRAATRALREHGVSFAQWRMLNAIALHERERGTPASQLDVSRRIEMDVSTASVVMGALSDKGLVDWQPDATGFAYRILVTSLGELVLARTRGDVVLAASTTLGIRSLPRA